MTGRILRAICIGGMAFALCAGAVPAAAQDDNSDVRLRKLESEVRALQRKVFPGGDGRFFEPEISGQPQQSGVNTAPSTTAVTDILARLDALETQIQRLTAQNEENAFALRGLTSRVEALEAAPKVAPGAAAPFPGTAPSGTDGASSGGNALPAASASKPVKAAAAPSPERVAAVQAIAKPQTDDAGDDEYSYGFRLWDAGFFPEAEQQLTMFLEKYPDHWRATYGRNLLGRAYLDDKKPREAAPWFLKNYQGDKTGARAGDSLLYLAESMIDIDDTKRACIALAEFSETYPALAAGRLQSQFEADRRKVKCN